MCQHTSGCPGIMEWIGEIMRMIGGDMTYSAVRKCSECGIERIDGDAY